MLEENDFEDDIKSVYKGLHDQYNSARDAFEKWDFGEGFLAEESDKVRSLLMVVEEKYSEFSELAVQMELQKLIDKLKKERWTHQLKEIENQIKEAEETDDRSRLLELLSRQQKLISSKYG